MLRKIGGVVAGYVAMVAFVIGTFSALYAILGAERSYQPNSYEVSMLWIVLTFVLGLFAAIFGGFLCKMISKSTGTVQVFAGIVLVVGIAMGIAVAMTEKPNEVRTGPVTNAEAMQKSQQPVWVAFLNPVIGAVGILIGGMIRKEK
ncbi:MAG: hypothetical protein R2681_04640 [Pyrinomonadaceae bacterium]